MTKPTPTSDARPSVKNVKNRKKKASVILLILALIAMAAAAAIYFLVPKPITGGDFYDQSAEAIQERIDHEVKDGYFNMTINSKVPVTQGTTALAGIQNIDSNHFDCKVTITLEDGTVVYESGGLAPGQGLETIELNQPLEPGEYAATALFEIFDQDEAHTQAGQTASRITLISQ